MTDLPLDRQITAFIQTDLDGVPLDTIAIVGADGNPTGLIIEITGVGRYVIPLTPEETP